MAKQLDWDSVLVVEDDLLFLNPVLFQSQLRDALHTAPFDVLLLAGNNVAPIYPRYESTCCVRVRACQTCLAYLVRKAYYSPLIENVQLGRHFLSRHPTLGTYFAIDRFWFLLQKRDRWLLLCPLTVVQLPGYSDIERATVDYTRMMLQLHKPYFQDPQFEAQMQYWYTRVQSFLRPSAPPTLSPPPGFV